MKNIAQISRILVGILFIFSGFVKLVDPVGTGLKLEEYFNVFANDLPSLSGFFHFFAEHSLLLSLIFCALEVVLGIIMLLSYRIAFWSWILLGMILFFTFLTFYSAYFNRVTDCGCFGDFLHLKPWASFQKDLILLVLSAIIFAFRYGYRSTHTGWLVTIASVLSLGIGAYAIRYLPFLEFTAFARGKNIPAQMIPEEKPIMRFKMEKNGQIQEFDQYPTDTTYKFIEAITLNEDKTKAKITDYSIQTADGNIVTDSTLKGKTLLIIFKKLTDTDKEELKESIALASKVANAGNKVFVLSSATADDIQKFRQDNAISLPFFTADEKILKTMARSNPTIMALKDGIVQDKWSDETIPLLEDLEKKW